MACFRGRRRRRFGVLVALAALYLQMAIAIAHDPRAAEGGALGVPICHLAQGGGPSSHGTPAPPCPVCQGLAACAASLPPPPVANGLLVRVPLDRPLVAASLPARRGYARAAAVARAPPAA